jgi:hypothetical protein
MKSKLYAMLLSLTFVPLGSSLAAADVVRVSNGTVVTCANGRRAVVHRVTVNGRVEDRVRCGPAARYETVAVHKHRSWKKSAAVIGGATAAGAGIGALAGGGKGALVGGAIGAGAGTAYDVHKRHKRYYVRRRVS